MFLTAEKMTSRFTCSQLIQVDPITEIIAVYETHLCVQNRWLPSQISELRIKATSHHQKIQVQSKGYKF